MSCRRAPQVAAQHVGGAEVGHEGAVGSVGQWALGPGGCGAVAGRRGAELCPRAVRSQAGPERSDCGFRKIRGVGVGTGRGATSSEEEGRLLGPGWGRGGSGFEQTAQHVTQERDLNDVSETDLLFTNHCLLATLPPPGARRRDSEERRRRAGLVRHPALTSAFWNARFFGAGERHPDRRPGGQAPQPPGRVPLNRSVSRGRGKCAAQRSLPLLRVLPSRTRGRRL